MHIAIIQGVSWLEILTQAGCWLLGLLTGVFITLRRLKARKATLPEGEDPR